MTDKSELDSKQDLIEPRDSFYDGESKKIEESLNKPEMSVKGVNRKFTKKWDIKFTIGSVLFKNIMEFLNEMSYDILFRFRKKEMKIYIRDPSDTHMTHVMFSNLEFAEYVVRDITDIDSDIGNYINSDIHGDIDSKKDDKEKQRKDDNEKSNEIIEKVFYVDMSIINDIIVSEDYPIDFYISLDEKKCYLVCGKEMVYSRLMSMSDKSNRTLFEYKLSEVKLDKMIKNDMYQKIVITHSAFKAMMNSLSLKTNKEKNVSIMAIKFNINEIDFLIEQDLKGSSYLISGNDVIVYPLRSDKILVNTMFLKKFNKLKFTYQVTIYFSSSGLPLMLETRLGAGKIFIYFGIALRVE